MIDKNDANIDELKNDLQDATLELKDLIEQTEDALARLDLGVLARVDLDDNNKLVFGKLHRRWRLYVERGNYPPSPLMNCSRKVRAEAMTKLKELKDNLILEAEIMKSQLKDSIESSKRFLKDD